MNIRVAVPFVVANERWLIFIRCDSDWTETHETFKVQSCWHAFVNSIVYVHIHESTYDSYTHRGTAKFVRMMPHERDSLLGQLTEVGCHKGDRIMDLCVVKPEIIYHQCDDVWLWCVGCRHGPKHKMYERKHRQYITHVTRRYPLNGFELFKISPVQLWKLRMQKWFH